MSMTDGYFDRLFETSDDPWAFRQRWYERRKRALTLAALKTAVQFEKKKAKIFEEGKLA